MSIEKLTIPLEVAEAIEELRKEGGSNYGILNRARVAAIYGRDANDSILHQWAFGRDREGNPDLLMSALVNGYEIEKSPEEKLREYYEGLKSQEDSLEIAGHSGSQFRQGWQSVEETLRILGITIEGINADKP